MTQAYVMPYPRFRAFEPVTNLPLSGGKVYTYQAGTTTPKATYTDATGVTPNANPVILDSNGEAAIFGIGFYKFLLQDSAGAQQWTIDNISFDPTGGVGGGGGGGGSAGGEWIIETGPFTYLSATTFSIAGDQRTTYQVNRRIQVVVTAGTLYGYIKTSTFASSVTTVTVVLDSGTLDSGLSAVSLGLLSTLHTSIPQNSLFQDGKAIYAADAGSNDTYVIALVPAITAYVTGMVINFKANTINTGAATLNVNGLGAKTIKKNKDVDLDNGDIKAGQIVTVIYDGTNFQLVDPNTILFTQVSGQIVTAQITAGAVTTAALDAGAVTSSKISATGYPQSGTGGEVLRIIRGQVTGAGGITQGSGFTVVHNSGNGDNTITFSTSFTTPPSVILTLVKAGTANEELIRLESQPTSSSFRALTTTGGTLSDLDFDFIAIGRTNAN